MSMVLPVAAIAAFLLLSQKKAPAAAAAAAKPVKMQRTTATSTLAKPRPEYLYPSDALQAAQLAEKQTGAPKSTQAVDVQSKVAQTVNGPALPAGYSSAAANMKAQPLADHVRTRKGKYDRALLQSFQTSAGLKPDGHYGPQSVAALRFFGAKNVPPALFKGAAKTYKPPGA